MASTSVGGVALDLTLNKSAFNRDVSNTVKSTTNSFKSAANTAESAFSSSFKKIGAVIASAFAVKQVVDFGKSCVQAAAEAQAAWTGLNSIVNGTGNNMGKAQQFLTKYTQDGLVAVEDAATAYKNLLARGYDTTQIENVMTALKDSAAFGRQSSYTLSQAVVSATEGLKNENSILVDNAGVTKNVAKMWDDYAASIGTTTNNLTQQQKIQAEVNGILTETKFQAGDAATYTSTFAGRVQQLQGAFSSMKTAIGKVVAPIANLFIPAITAAVNAVTTFFTALARVLAIFGLEFPDVVQKASTVAGGAAQSIGAIGDSADETAGNLARTGSAAQKAAKKMNKAFASVDELNVMKFNKQDSSSGSGGSGGSGGSSGGGTLGGVSGGGAIDTGNTAVGSAIENTSKKIQSALEPLTKINFDNLVRAFGKLKEAVSAVGGTLWDGIKWAYYNILVPLAQWTIEDLLPAFFNLLSGALQVLNPILVAFGEIFVPIWNNVLQPIAAWTGGVIVDVLNGIADALSTIGDWMSSNQSTVTTITKLLLGFFAAWKLTELMAFIQMSGGLVAAISAITGALLANIAAKVIDKAETIYLTVLYAKDFVVACGQAVVALMAQAAAFVVANAGIILVVAGIVALIAIIVLLVKHWDEVKEAAIKCWEYIKETWQSVKDWFNQNVVEPVKKFFADLWNKIKQAGINAWNGIKNTWQSVKNWFNTNIITPVSNFFKNMWDKIKNAASSAWNSIKGVWQIVSGWFNSTIVQPVSNFFSGMWDRLKNGASNAWAGIKNVFSAVGSFFRNTFSNAWNAVKNIFSTGGQIFDGIKEGIVSSFTSIVNGIISGINRVVQIPFNGINRALSRLRNISILDVSPFKWLPTISIPQIPYLAQGAYFQKNNPTLAVVGDNTTQGEFVTPENKLKQSVKEAMQELGGMFGNDNLKFDFTIRQIGDDGRTIIKKINDVTISDGKVTLIV